MFKANETVNLNGKDYKISQIEWSKGHKACMLCASANGRPPCIDLFDYPNDKDTFGLRQCTDNMPEFHIPKLVKKTFDMTEFELEQIAYARAAECRANMYKSESRVWNMLQRHNDTFGLDWQTQIPIIIPWDLKEEYESKAFYIADFWEPENNIIIEVDGEQHSAYNDTIRDNVLEELGYTTYRIKSLDVWNWYKLSTFICHVYDTERIWYSRILI